jgi:UDP-glucose 4-epimerase
VRVVVVGATGNVGTAVVQALGDDAAVSAILGIARRVPARSLPKTTWVSADVAEDDLVTHLRGADAVINLAWIFQPTRDPLRTWRVNVLGGIRLFDATAAAGVTTLVHASSIGAYSPGPQEGAVDESWPTHSLPTVAYGREKAYLERVLDTYEHEHPEIRVVRLRPGFIFQRTSAAEQRRLFAGPLLPNLLVRESLIPVVPDLPGLRLQALHAADAAQAYRLAVTQNVRGAFNIAADPIVDTAALADLFDARVVRASTPVIRSTVAAAWHLRVIPASPELLDLALGVPAMDTSRARDELGWRPQVSALDAIAEFLEGLREGAGGDTPQLREDAGGRFRWREFATGVGGRDRQPRSGQGG